MAKNKSSKSKNKTVKNNILHPRWEELRDVGFLTIEDIKTPHMIVDELMKTYSKEIESDKELKEVCEGLNKSYYDCLDKCFSIMAQHVEGYFPKTAEEVAQKPELFTNAKFKEGEVGFGIEDKDTLYNQIVLYNSLHSQYQLLGHEVYALTHKGKVAMEMKLSAKYNANRSEEEIKQSTQKLLEENRRVEESLKNAKELINIAAEERQKMTDMQLKLK